LKPTEIKQNIGNYEFIWNEPDIYVKVSRIRSNKDYLKAELEIKAEGRYLHETDINLLAGQSKTRLAKFLKEDRYPQADWDDIIETIAYHTKRMVRAGEPVVELDTSKEQVPLVYLLYPILPEKQPTVIFGEPGVGKSQIAYTIAICLMLPWVDNPMGWQVPETPKRVLYLDYETSHEETTRRLKQLLDGMDLGYVNLPYRRCYNSLVDDVEQIVYWVNETQADVLIIDSLAAAVGGDPNKAEFAIPFFNTLRSLDKSSLIIAQTSKAQDGKNKSILGSTIYTYYSRSIWELRQAEASEEGDEVSVALFHSKVNISRKQKPIGLRYCFNGNKTTVETEDVESVPEFQERLSASSKILRSLTEGKKSPKELVEELGIPEGTIRVSLKRLRQRGKVEKSGVEYYLPYEE